MYGRAEEVVGDLAAKLGVQPKLFLATKVWTTGKAAGIRQMEDSMRKLRAARIDLMQVHNLVDVDTHLATLAAWKREGRVRYVGVTHYTAGQPRRRRPAHRLAAGRLRADQLLGRRARGRAAPPAARGRSAARR